MKLMRMPPVDRLASTDEVSKSVSATPAWLGMVPPPQPPPIIVLRETPFMVSRWSCVWPPWMPRASVFGPSAPPTSWLARPPVVRVTPGMRTPRLNMLRPVGSASACARVTTVWRVVDCRSTTGGSPVTVIVSDTLPTFMSALRVRLNDPLNSTPSRLTVLKPVSANVTV